MKKTMALICAFLLLFAVLNASAQTVQPAKAELPREFLGGRTFSAWLSGWGIWDEEERFELYFTICERDRFDAAMIDALQPEDELRMGDGEVIRVKSVDRDEYGVYVNQNLELYGTVAFYPGEDGYYTAVDLYEHPYWTDVVTVTIQVDTGVIYRDSADPDAAEPTDRSAQELKEDIVNDVSFSRDNTRITFDEEGSLIMVERLYTPWN